MIDIIEELQPVVKREADRITKERIPYADEHHAYSILKEEVEEAEEEIETLKVMMNSLWDSVRTDSIDNCKTFVKGVRGRATAAAAELVQVAAVCDKYLRGQQEGRRSDKARTEGDYR